MPLMVFVCCTFTGVSKSIGQSTKVFTVKATQIKAPVQPTMWGIFFEDINFGADGGIYAELVKNRSFEFSRPLMGWRILGKPKTEGDFLVQNRQQSEAANPRFLRVTVHDAAKGTIGMSNEGFRGMGIKNGLRYDFSVMYRQPSANIKRHIELVDTTGKNIGSTMFTPAATAGDEWKKRFRQFYGGRYASQGPNEHLV